jgi:Domain of unknown function (DUF362)
MDEKKKVVHSEHRYRFYAWIVGFGALIWFLIRVIPKPSRATYPCQRAAFPLATSFVLWVVGSASGMFAALRKSHLLDRYRWLTVSALALVALSFISWFIPSNGTSASDIAAHYNYTPQQRNCPMGIARGVFPGLVVWAHDPQATKWSGHIESTTDQWWMDSNIDQARVDAMLSAVLQKLTGVNTDEAAWRIIFAYYNLRARGLSNRGYQSREIVAVKINLNNSSVNGPGNVVNVSPQVALAMVRQLIRQGHVRESDILVYDARRDIYPAVLTKIWSEFKDVRFVQQDAPDAKQPVNPAYGDHHGLEAAQWVEGISYSANDYHEAKLMPKQVFDATYLVNVALLKAHSYPYASQEGGDEGQTGVTLTGKNHFGSIKGTPELHEAINTNQKGTPHAYSPIVDLAASPNLGAKTILYLLEGLYCARRHQSFPLHFPNPPFNNRVAPYENPEWPSSLLASLDGVALDSVGLDILYSQSKNNEDENHRPRILIRENADDYLREEATPDHPPSGTPYRQNGHAVASLGVFEHWDNDATRQYSRNKDPKNGKGIELLYERLP